MLFAQQPNKQPNLKTGHIGPLALVHTRMHGVSQRVAAWRTGRYLVRRAGAGYNTTHTHAHTQECTRAHKDKKA